MYLKKLELSGFKSFADKSQLNLSPGINVVVGPNGCGKSNILDAIRWGLGEQRTTVLRSRQMDEVIFAGTKDRPPAGMAQISFTLDNSDGKFPTDEPEVTICRRIFRDGAGQYLINKKSSRLKDLQESIADTGIGQGALFVLSAQEVIQVLSPNANDRRAILEETAGINKYQIRKKETLRRLQSTKENIARLNDILQEVNRQVELSEKQLAKLNRYKKLKEGLSRLECSVVLKDRSKLDEDETILNNSTKNLDERRTALDREIESVRFEIYDKEKKKKLISEALEREREQYSKLNGEEAEIRSSIDVALDRISQGEKAVVEYESNRASLLNRYEKTDQKIKDNRGRIGEIAVKLKALSEEYEEKNLRFLEFEQKFSLIHEEVEGGRKKLNSLKEKLKISELNLQHGETGLESLLREKSGNEDKALKLMEELEKSEDQTKTWNNKLNEQKAEKDLAAGELEKLENRERDTQKKLADLEKERRNLEQRLFSIRSELSVLLREEEDFRGFSEAFRKLMKNKNLLPPLTPIHKIIQVDEEYEAAIDIVLGAHFQSIITENRRDADSCIDYLKRERAGRLTFFPLDINRSSRDFMKVDRRYPGPVDWARNLIQCDSRYREIIDTICGKTMIVEDLKSAYNLYDHWKRDGSFLPRMVTLDGDVLDFSGAVTGGKYRTDRSKLLSSERRRRELEEEGKAKAGAMTKCEKNLSILKETNSSFAKTKKELSTKVRLLENEIRNVSGQLQLIERLQKNAGEDLKRIEESEKTLQSRIDDQNIKIENFRKEIESNRDLLKELEEELEGRDSAYKDQTEKMNLLQSELNRVQKQIEENDHQEKMLNSGVDNDTNYLNQIKTDISELESKISERKTEMESLKFSLQETKNRNSVLKLKLKALKIGMDSSRKQAVSVDKDLEQSREMDFSLSKRKEELDSAFNDLRIQKIEMESRRKYLEDRLNEFDKETVKDAERIRRDSEDVQQEINRTRQKLNDFEAINFSAEEEFNENSRRFEELQKQIDDLQESATNLRKIVREMDTVSLKALDETLTILNNKFSELFKKIFGGGSAGVSFSDPENKLESGIDITVKPPGKRASNINLLSSGEKSMTAITFLFALLSIKPGPFVILDELDAPLDETNVEKIAKLVREFSDKSQFIVITHNRKTMEFSDVMFGVTMEEPGVSKLVSVKMN